MSATPPRFAVIGTGRMAARMMRSFAALPGVQVVAVASATPGRAADFAGRFGLGIHGTVDAIIARDDIDAVYIASRNADHAAIAIAALQAGKAVLCEKPAAISSDEAARVVAAARASGTLFMEAICTPFLPAFARAVSLARGGTLGDPRHLVADFSYPAPACAHPNIHRQPGGGVLLDRLVYPAVLALAVFGPVDRVRCSIAAGDDDPSLDVEAGLMLDHRGGGRSEISVSLLSLASNAATIGCRGGRIELMAPLTGPERIAVTPVKTPAARAGGLLPDRVRDRLKQSALVRRLASVGSKAVERHAYGGDAYAPELAHFCSLLREGRSESPLVPFETTLAVQALVAAARADAGMPAS
jgi:predicted dehydrogenase